MKKTLAILLAALILGLTLTACSGKNEASGWEYVKDKGVLVVGLDDTFAPMGFRDDAGNLQGFDIDLANAVGEVLGIEIEFQPIDWTAKETELSSKRIDCIWNGMSVTPSRQKEMSLTKKYLKNQIIIMSLDNDVNVESVEDLAKLKVGTQSDSSALERMQQNSAYDSFKDNITEYGTYDEALLDMQAGRIDCIVVDRTLAYYKNTKLDDASKMHESAFNFGDDYYAIGCRLGETDLTDKINDAVKTLIDNGKAAEISQKWFGENIVVLEGY